MKYHNIKLNEHYASDVYHGKKTFEIRKNDRDYKVGDRIQFTVVKDDGHFKPNILNSIYYEITYILDNFPDGLKEEYIVFTIRRID